MATDETKEYEIAFLARDEKEAEGVLGVIARFGAEVIFHGPVEKISLAYPIKKETSAYFGYFHFTLDSQKIASLARELRMNSAVIRFLIVSPPFVKTKAKIIQKTKRTPQPAVDRKIEPLPLSNEALEKKIEEILQE